MMLFFRLPRWPTLRPASVGFFLLFCAGFADGMVVPFFPLWAHNEAGIAVGFIGLLFGCYAGGELIATPFIGGIADRIGRRPVLVSSSLGVGLGFVALYFTHGVTAAAIVLLAIGICESVLHPTISTVIAETTPASTHRRQFSLARVSSSLGRVAGPAAGAALAWASLGTVFLAAGAALLIGGTIILLRLPETRQAGEKTQSDEDEEAEETLAALLPAFRDKRLATLLLWFMLLEVAGSWLEAVLPLYAEQKAILTPSGVGLLFSYGAALIALAQLPLTRMAEGRSATLLILLSGGVLMLAFAALTTFASLWVLMAAVTLYSVSQMLSGPLVPTAVNQLAPVELRATYMAATSVASDLRDSIGPATGTALYAASSKLPWIIAIPVTAVAAIGLAVTVTTRSDSISPLEEKSSDGTARPGRRPDTVRICGLR